MNSKAQVTVIIPAYNQADYLGAALDSVAAQSHPGCEVVVVDDGSTDRTAEIVKEHSLAPHYIFQENQGLAAARNTGIRAAKTRFVAFLDSDDAWEPNYLGQMLALAEAHPEGAVYYCGVHYMDRDGRPTPQQGDSQVVAPDEMYETLLRSNFLVPSTILARTAALRAVNLFDPVFRRLQDWELWRRMTAVGYRFVGSSERLVRYRLHSNSLSSNADGGRRAALALTEKQFGEDDGKWEQWSDDKRRAYGGAYRYCALITLTNEKEWSACAPFVRRALQIDPSLMHDVSFLYELALGPQPLGYRGTKQFLDLEQNEREIRRLLNAVFTTDEIDADVRRATFGTAYFVLGLVAYNTGQVSLSRDFSVTALRYRPDLWKDRAMQTRLLKLFLGASTLRRVRQWRSARR